MREFAYASLNTYLESLWATIAPGTPIIFGHPTPPATLPATCLQVYWFGYGSPSASAPGRDEQIVQLSIFLLGAGSTQPIKKALAQSSALDAALGILRAQSMHVIDVTDDAGAVVGRMDIRPDGAGPQQVDSSTLRQAQISRRIFVSWNAT